MSQHLRHADPVAFGARLNDLSRYRRYAEILQRQREKFIARYGREPGPDDPIFVDVPSDDEYDEMVTKAMEQAGVAPAVIYAFRKTGRIITEENAKFVPAAALEAWQHAMTSTRS
jgi:hypothetical protein